ncbi:MAG: hypothetical protein II461_03780, partial [Treponema sp.]|nr:hypothetical protein [Treponema sp.]
GTMPKNPVAVKTIVSTDIVNKMAAEYGVELREVLTGFKFIGEQIGLLEKDGEDDRRAIVVFADDMPEFFAGLDDALGFIEKDRKEKAKARAEKKAKKEAMYSKSANSDDGDSKKSKMRVYRRKGESRLVSAKRAEKQGAEGGKSVRPHVVSKRAPQSDNSEEY